MSNSNCLEGVKCPNCGSLGPFRIWATMEGWAEVDDDGVVDHQGDVEWEDTSLCQCFECGNRSDVAGFKKGFEK